MVHILKRSTRLRHLSWIRCGPGALILPPEVSKISMEFNKKLYGGHRGARKFWREMLPRIKLRNPTVPIEIKRHNEAEGPSVLHIYTHRDLPSSSPSSSSSSSSSPPSSASDDTPAAPTHTLDIRNLQESEILEALVKTIGAAELEPTEEDKAEMQKLAEQKERSDADRLQMREYLVKQRAEEKAWKMARRQAHSLYE